jgi:hypothetical protein
MLREISGTAEWTVLAQVHLEFGFVRLLSIVGDMLAAVGGSLRECCRSYNRSNYIFLWIDD